MFDARAALVAIFADTGVLSKLFYLNSLSGALLTRIVVIRIGCLYVDIIMVSTFSLRTIGLRVELCSLAYGWLKHDLAYVVKCPWKTSHG